jgi:hypothetical protein
VRQGDDNKSEKRKEIRAYLMDSNHNPFTDLQTCNVRYKMTGKYDANLERLSNTMDEKNAL